MAYAHSDLTLTEKLSRKLSISGEQSRILKKTYLLLSLAVIGMAIGGNIGMRTPAVLNLFQGWLGWILAMVVLNSVPLLALKFRHEPVLGMLAVFADGLVAGLVIAPMLYIGEMLSGQNLVSSAAWVTLAIFGGVTAYVYYTGTRWAPNRALYTGLFFGILGAIVLNMFLNIGLLGLLIAAGIGVIGVIALVSATSEILHNPEIDSPVPGALMLFSGIFMIFQSVFHLLLMFTGGGNE